MNPALDLARLRATLGAPEFVRLLDALKQRLARGRPLSGRLTLTAATAAERQAVDTLFGRAATRGDSLRIDLDLLAEILADAGLAPSLPAAVEALRGPVTDRASEAAQHAAAWSALREMTLGKLDAWPALSPWGESLFASGVLKRLAGGSPGLAESLVADVLRVAAALPVRAEPLAAFAARLFGDAHALDPGSARATLSVRAAACLGGTPFEDDAEGRRAAWAGVGVLCDELSTPALTLHLPASADTPLGRLLRLARTEAEPVHLTLRLLLAYPLADDPALADREIFVCENPTIVALAARRLGPRCAPLVCVNGQYATPVKILLRQLAAAGARLRYHGDFDLGGLAIARRVISEHGARPWRLSAADYLAAPKGAALPATPGPALASPWSPELAGALERAGCVVHEEAVAEQLLADLAAAWSATALD